MKRYYVLLSMLLALALGACQSSVPAPEATEPPVAPTTSDEMTETPSSSPTAPEATAKPSDYPAPTTAPALESGYPAAPEEAEPPVAYPAGEPVWMILPQGEQCADESTFASLSEAVSALEEADVNVLSSETVELMVCEACGCPTSEHYRVQIRGEDVEAARSLGWTTE